MPRGTHKKKHSKYARLLKPGDKFYEGGIYTDIFTVVRVDKSQLDGGLLQIFVKDRVIPIVYGYHHRVKIHHEY